MVLSGQFELQCAMNLELSSAKPSVDDLTDYAIDRLLKRMRSPLLLSSAMKRNIITLLLPTLDDPAYWDMDWRPLLGLSDADWPVTIVVEEHPTKPNCFFVQSELALPLIDQPIISAWCEEQFDQDDWTGNYVHSQLGFNYEWTLTPGAAALFKMKWC